MHLVLKEKLCSLFSWIHYDFRYLEKKKQSFDVVRAQNRLYGGATASQRPVAESTQVNWLGASATTEAILAQSDRWINALKGRGKGQAAQWQLWDSLWQPPGWWESHHLTKHSIATLFSVFEKGSQKSVPKSFQSPFHFKDILIKYYHFVTDKMRESNIIVSLLSTHPSHKGYVGSRTEQLTYSSGHLLWIPLLLSGILGRPHPRLPFL